MYVCILCYAISNTAMTGQWSDAGGHRPPRRVFAKAATTRHCGGNTQRIQSNVRLGRISSCGYIHTYIS